MDDGYNSTAGFYQLHPSILVISDLHPLSFIGRRLFRSSFEML